MKNIAAQSTFVTETIKAWLSDMTVETQNASRENTQRLLNAILLTMGYSEPFDEEQRAINDMLLMNYANAESCLAAWEFYNSFYDQDVCLKELALAA